MGYLVAYNGVEILRRLSIYSNPVLVHEAVDGLACAALIELIDCISNAYYSPDEKKDYEAISPALAYINSNYNKCISLDTLADITGYSKSHFSHIFSETIGTTPKKYQNDIRMKISREMLTSTKYTIGDVAESCGFSDPLYFSRVFKKTYGISPTEYRKNKSGINIEIINKHSTFYFLFFCFFKLS